MHFSPRLGPLYTAFLVLHVASGFVAMYGGLVPLFGKKGGVDHRRWGWIFTYAMGVCALSSLPLAGFHSDILQAAIGAFSGYGALLGVRILRRHKRPERILRFESAFAVCALLLFGALLAFGWANQNSVALLFGALGIFLSARDVNGLLVRDFSPARRISDHLLATTFSLTSAYSAFLNTQFNHFTGLEWPPIAKMGLPFALALPAILFFAARWNTRLARLPSP